MIKQKITTPKFQVFVWSLFDFANSSFSIMIITVGFPLFFKEVIVGDSGRGDLFWGIAISMSMLLTAIVAPILGAASDFSHRRKRFLFGFTILSVISTALLYFINPGMIIPAMILLILANVGFEGGIVFYDSFLPMIAPKESYGRVSGYGFAFGYIGSLITLIIAIPLYAKGFIPENFANIKLSFVISAAIFFVFSIPLFAFLRDHRITFNHKVSFLAMGFRRVKRTISHLKNYKNVATFLLAFFIYNDGILTIISFSSIFAKQTLHFELNEVFILFAIVQISAFVGSIVFGIFTDHYGPKKTITITLLNWILVVVLSFFVTDKFSFFLIATLAGVSLGSSQASSRSLMAQLTPKEHEAEFFGFYDGFCGKASAVVGTFLFGLISYLMNDQRLAVLTIGIFFIVGLIILQFVDDKQVITEEL